MKMFCSCNFPSKKEEILALINNMKIYKNDNDNNKMITMLWQKHNLYYQFIFFSEFMHIFFMLLQHWHSLQLNFSTSPKKKKKKKNKKNKKNCS